MPVSAWMIEGLALEPGLTVLELAAGPGDTGFLAAELITPGGTLICSDGAEEMLEVARARAQHQDITNVEFRRLQLEWIDLETASVDALLCRWGLMLVVDPAAALREMRRVLRPGGRVSLSVWDEAEHNPWATIPGRALVELGHAAPPEPNTPGMFALAESDRLRTMLEDAGFIDAEIDAVGLPRTHDTVEAYLEATLDLARPFARVYTALQEEQRKAVRQRIESSVQPYVHDDGSLRFPARALVAAASA
jgi:SAM-dependent methyltransferase